MNAIINAAPSTGITIKGDIPFSPVMKKYDNNTAEIPITAKDGLLVNCKEVLKSKIANNAPTPNSQLLVGIR